MRTMTAEDVEADFENTLALCEQDAIRVQRDGVDVAIMLSPALYEFLTSEQPPGVNPLIVSLFKKSVVKRSAVYRALARYEAEHPEDN